MSGFSPLGLVSTAAKALKDGAPTVARRLSHATSKADLKLGDHIYVWRGGYTFSHHGIVVHLDDCDANCQHSSLSCCGVVHFNPVDGKHPIAAGLNVLLPNSQRALGAIDLTSLGDFASGHGVCKCHYGVAQAEFLIKRAGSCSTRVPDPWPLVVLRALSLVDAQPASDVEGGIEVDDDALVEYSLLTKNCELLSLWCCLGAISGVQRFRSTERAYSSQSAPARFVRLGVATAGAAAAGGVLAASGSAAAGAAGAGGASAEAAAGGVAASTGMASLGSGATALLTAGGAVASTALKSLIEDVVRRPHVAAELLTQTFPEVARAAQPPVAERPSAASPSPEDHIPIFVRRKEALTTALRVCLEHLGATIPPGLQSLAKNPWGCCRLCEIFVDALEAESPSTPFEMAAVVQLIMDDLAV